MISDCDQLLIKSVHIDRTDFTFVLKLAKQVQIAVQVKVLPVCEK